MTGRETLTAADEIRRKIFRMVVRAGGGHITPSFSLAEILAVLYGSILRVDPARPLDPDRDRLVLSKGHGCAALYAALAQFGFVDEDVLETFCQSGSVIGGHPNRGALPGIEATTGALGHGFAFAAGMALAGRRGGRRYRVFAILGDGECQEGSVWEAALFAAHQRLDNLTAIIDSNKLQAMGPVEEIMGLEPLADKWRSFNWEVRETDGHDPEALRAALAGDPSDGRPVVVIAHTVKGKGVSFMENVPIWHYRLPNEDEMKTALRELDMD